MYRISGQTWVIEDREEFLEECDAAFRVMNHVREEESDDDVQWAFAKCFANWDREEFTVLFGRTEGPEIEDHMLNVAASRDDDGEWSVHTVKRVRRPSSMPEQE